MDNLLNYSAYNCVLVFGNLFCASLLLQFIVSFNDQYFYFKSNPARSYGKSIKLLGVFQIPKLNELQFLIAGFAFAMSLILITIGFLPRFFVFIATISYFLYFSQIISLAYIQRKTNLIPITLLFLLFSPSFTKSLSHHGSNSELILVKLALAQIYLSAGLQKIGNSGLSWCNGNTLRAYLLENYLWSDNILAFYLSKKKILCSFLSTAVLIFEVTFCLAIFFKNITLYYVVFALLFHIGTLIIMRINYLKYILPVYMVFFTDVVFQVIKIIQLKWSICQKILF